MNAGPEQAVDLILKIHRATSWGPYGTYAGESPVYRPARPAGTTARAPSCRDFAPSPIPLQQIEDLVCRVYCRDQFDRTPTPSAGNLGAVGVSLISYPGGRIYEWKRGGFSELTQLSADLAERLIYRQLTGPAWLVLFTANISVIATKYGARGYRFALLEAGHLCEALLQETNATALRCCPLGAFDDFVVQDLLALNQQTTVALYMMAVGTPAGK